MGTPEAWEFREPASHAIGVDENEVEVDSVTFIRRCCNEFSVGRPAAACVPRASIAEASRLFRVLIVEIQLVDLCSRALVTDQKLLGWASRTIVSPQVGFGDFRELCRLFARAFISVVSSPRWRGERRDQPLLRAPLFEFHGVSGAVWSKTFLEIRWNLRDVVPTQSSFFTKERLSRSEAGELPDKKEEPESAGEAR